MEGSEAESPFPTPPGWTAFLAGARLEPVAIGRSAAAVLRVRRPDGDDLVLKSEPSGPAAGLSDERARLAWAHGRGLPCPRPVALAEHDGAAWLAMTALPGRDLASTDLAPGRIVDLLVEALRRLHAEPIEACPFDQRLDVRLPVAAARVDAGAVDESDFDAPCLGLSARAVLAEVLALRPREDDLVVAHGDACLPNFIAAPGRPTGLVDLGRLGVADRHQDLALARRSVAYNLGDAWGEAFLAAYGGPVDRRRLDYYQLLDELF
jgi:aminoglycoside 3'-phosphotransferase II